MSLIPGNVEVLAFAFQDDKDSPADEPVMAIALEDCSLDPGVQKIQTAETDASALAPDDIVVGAQPGGTFKTYMRPSNIDLFLYALLGKNGDTGSSPTTHTASLDPDAPFTTPYLTVWDIWPGIGAVQYSGVRFGQLVATSQEGGAVETEFTLAALKALFLDLEDAPDLADLFVDEQPFTWAELAVSLGGDHDGIVTQYSLTVNRNANRFQGDNGFQSLDIPNGLFAVNGSMTVAFEDDELWRAANTGTVDGDELTTTIFEESIDIDHARGTDLEAKFSLANAQITNFKTKIETDGKPATASFDFKSSRSDDVTDVLTTVVKNAIAHADRTPAGP